MEKVNVAEKFDLFSDYWSPKIAAELNDPTSSWQNSKASSFGIITKMRTSVPRDEGSVTNKAAR